MNDKWQQGCAMAVGACVLGVLADSLLRASPPGLNALLWFAALGAMFVGLSRCLQLPLLGGGRWMLIAMLGFAAAVAFRDSTLLKAANLAAALVSLTLVMVRGRAGRLWNLSIVQGIACLVIAGMNAAIGSIVLLHEGLPWRSIAADGNTRRAGAIVRGLLLALPLMLVFGGLFAAADASFASLMSRLMRFDPTAVTEHCLCILIGTWVTGGILWSALTRDDEHIMRVERPAWIGIGITEVGIALGALNGLFALFVCLQARYLFGGQGHVLATAGLTASDYARRGFFELVAVAGMVLPLLLVTQALLRDSDRRSRAWFSSLASVLILLTYLVMASAVQRMALYSVGFGLTELRLYTTAFMGAVALILLWYAATSLRGRDGFCIGALACCLAVLALLDVVNPDALIVRTNVAQRASRGGFDAEYAASLSGDAVPELLRAWPRLSEAQRIAAAPALNRRWLAARGNDWRMWNAGRSAAASAARRSADSIRAYAALAAAERAKTPAPSSGAAPE
jgi:hypothetical protein